MSYLPCVAHSRGRWREAASGVITVLPPALRSTSPIWLASSRMRGKAATSPSVSRIRFRNCACWMAGKTSLPGASPYGPVSPFQEPGDQVRKFHVPPFLHDHLVVQRQVNAFKRHVGRLHPAAAAPGARTHHVKKPQGSGIRIAAAFQHFPRPRAEGLEPEHAACLMSRERKFSDVGVHPSLRILRAGELSAGDVREQQPPVRGRSGKKAARSQSHAVQEAFVNLRVEIGYGEFLQGDLRALVVPRFRLVPALVIRSGPLEPHVMAGGDVGHMAAGELLAGLHGGRVRHAVHGVPAGEGNLPLPVQAAWAVHSPGSRNPPGLPGARWAARALYHGRSVPQFVLPGR